MNTDPADKWCSMVPSVSRDISAKPRRYLDKAHLAWLRRLLCHQFPDLPRPGWKHRGMEGMDTKLRSWASWSAAFCEKFTSLDMLDNTKVVKMETSHLQRLHLGQQGPRPQHASSTYYLIHPWFCVIDTKNYHISQVSCLFKTHHHIHHFVKISVAFPGRKAAPPTFPAMLQNPLKRLQVSWRKSSGSEWSAPKKYPAAGEAKLMLPRNLQSLTDWFLGVDDSLLKRSDDHPQYMGAARKCTSKNYESAFISWHPRL